MQKLTSSIFNPIRCLVAGDVMLDQYWFGSVERISPEAPVPVLAVKKEEYRVGGAANVAYNLCALGAKSHLLSVVGEDTSANTLTNLLQEYGVQCQFHTDKVFKTIVKLRMMAQNQQLLRADFETPPSDEVLMRCWHNYQQVLPECDVVILSDYGKGGLAHVAQMIKYANEINTPVIIDPKGTDYSGYKGAHLITPNMKEFEAVVGVVNNTKDFHAKAAQLCKQLSLRYLLVTQSDKGMSLFSEQGLLLESPARAREVFDVSGAGDTVIATIALSLIAGVPQQTMLDLANTAAGIVVAKIGTAVAEIEQVIQEFNRQFEDNS